MATRRLSLAEKFLYGYPLLSAIRKAIGILIALVCLHYLFGNVQLAIFGAFGALCLSMMDLPGSPRQTTFAFLIGSGLALLSASLTALTAPYPYAVTTVLTLLTVFFSMLVVYGRRGAMTSIACLLLSLVVMYAAGLGLATSQLILAVASGLGIYMAINISLAFVMQRWEQAQCLSMALYATAKYLSLRARMLDPRANLDDAARAAVAAQGVMAERHQSARDMIFDDNNLDTNQPSPRHHELARVLYHTVSLHDMLLGSYEDYKLLRQSLGKHDILTLSASILSTLAEQIDWVALAVANNKAARQHSSVTQKLTALELAITQFENDEAATAHPDLLPIIKQLQERLITGNDCVHNMIKETRSFAANNPSSEQALPPLPAGMLSRQSYSPRLLWQNLRLDSPPFRFALRVSIAVLLGSLIGVAFPQLGAHAYWIVLTIIIIMKPAFALTKQRNYERLSGTLIGCLIAFALCSLTTNHVVLGVVIGVSLLLIPTFMFINYQVAVVLITLLVLLSLQLLLPHSVNLIAERGLDTVIGSIIALACSRILPWWEAKSLPDLARALAERTADLLTAALDQMRADTANAPTPKWSLAKRDALLAYSNFANALYRMMREPKAQQVQAQTYNDLLVACHVLATEISTIVFLSQRSKHPLSQETADILQAMSGALRTQRIDDSTQWSKYPWWSDAPPAYEHPLRQLHLAFERTINDLNALNR